MNEAMKNLRKAEMKAYDMLDELFPDAISWKDISPGRELLPENPSMYDDIDWTIFWAVRWNDIAGVEDIIFELHIMIMARRSKDEKTKNHD